MNEDRPLPRRELTPEEKKMVEEVAKTGMTQGKVRNIQIGIGLRKDNGKVALQFSEMINLIELEPDGAYEIGKQMMKKAKRGREIRAALIKEGRDPGMPQAKRILIPAGGVVPPGLSAGMLKRN